MGRLKEIPSWVLVLTLIVFLLLSAFFLRQNFKTMVSKRNAIVSLDEKTGDLSKLEPLIEDYGEFVLSHMNTRADEGALELPGAYSREVDKVIDRARKNNTPSSNVYKEAQKRCKNSDKLVQADCIQSYVLNQSTSNVDFPDKTLFTYDFANPRWSFDLAGISVLFSWILGIWILARIIKRGLWPRLISSSDPLS